MSFLRPLRKVLRWILLGLVAVGVLFWAARSGQFDDLDGDSRRILLDDDLPPVQPGKDDARGGGQDDRGAG